MSPLSRISVIGNSTVAYIRDATGLGKGKQHTIVSPPLLLTPTNRTDIIMSSSSPISGTGICSTTAGDITQILVFYQLLNGNVGLSTWSNDTWSSSELQITPAYASPLACVSWNTGGQASGSIYFTSSQADGNVARSACTTSTPATSSRSIATLQAPAGTKEPSAI